MISRRDLGSWLDGPLGGDGADGGPPWRGARLGAPESGPGSLAGYPGRLLALGIDWVACLLIATAAVPGAGVGTPDSGLATLAVFVVEVALLTTLAGASFGQLIVGLRLTRVSGGRLTGAPAGPLPVLARTLLLATVLPALVVDRDGRGLHDRLAGTALVRRRGARAT